MSKHIQGFLILLLLFAIFGCGEGATSGDPLGTDSITVTASVMSLGAGEDSIITATVVRLDKSPATDRLVSFRIITNNSGGMFRFVNDKVDGQSKAVAVYTAGTKDPEKYAEDTIQASLSNGASASVTIARFSKTKPYIATLTTDPIPDISINANQSKVVIATVKAATIDKTTGKTIENPVSGVTVFFSIPVTNSGSPALTAYSGVSDDNGIVTTVYTPGNASPTDKVDDTVQASLADGSSRAVVITRTGATSTPSTSTLTIIADPASVKVPAAPGGIVNTVLTVMVKDQNGNPVSGAAVNITVTPAIGTFNPVIPVTTGNDGKAITNYTTGVNVNAGSIVFTAQAPVLNISASTSVTVTQ